jgi:16S rRNA (adenine1518-N6/adenine1519-N6)-dimethyltransferase
MKIKEICRKFKIVPLKKRGQNFLINKRILEKILKVAEIKKDDTILEIGAGFGNLTEELAKKAKKS